MTTAERLLEEARELPREELAWLVDQLWGFLDETGELTPLSPAWEAEIARRVDEIDSGKVALIPLDEARQRWGLPAARHRD